MHVGAAGTELFLEHGGDGLRHGGEVVGGQGWVREMWFDGQGAAGGVGEEWCEEGCEEKEGFCDCWC